MLFWCCRMESWKEELIREATIKPKDFEEAVSLKQKAQSLGCFVEHLLYALSFPLLHNFLITNSTRLFNCLVSSVSLLAIGFEPPYPLPVMRFLLMPFPTR